MVRQTFNFGFDGSKISSGGTGGFTISYQGPVFYPAQIFTMGSFSFEMPAFTSSPSVTATSPYGYNGTLIYGGPDKLSENTQASSYMWQYGTYQKSYDGSSDQNQAVWLGFVPAHTVNGVVGNYGWAEFSFNNQEAVLAAVAFATSGDIAIGDTGNGMYTPVVLQDVATTAAVPEPSQVAASLLLAAGIAGFVIVRRRKEASELEALAA